MNQKIFISFSLFITIVFLNGCQSAMSVFYKTDSQYEKGLQYTKVKSIVYKNKTKAIINATYLNSINKQWDNKYQNFLIGIYIVEDNEKENTKYINNTQYILTMNNQKIIKNILLAKEDKLYKNVPLKNPWARYYIVSFLKTNPNVNKTLTLKYSNSIFGEVLLPFEKE